MTPSTLTVSRVKHQLRRVTFVRDYVRRRRMRRGQQDWTGLVLSARNFSQDRAAAAATDRRVLLATGGAGYSAGSRIDSLLAVALIKRGVQPHVLLCDGALPACLQCTVDWDRDEALFAAKGPTSALCAACFSPADEMYSQLGVRVHRFSEYISEQERLVADELSSSIPLDEIEGFNYNGVAVGEHAHAGALRFYARATLEDRFAEAIVRRYLRAGLIASIVSQRLVSSMRFDRAVLHHGIYVPQGVMAETFRRCDVPIVTWHVAYRKRSLIFSHDDTYHRTLMTEPTSAWENMEWSSAHEDRILSYLRSRWHGTEDWISFNRNPTSDPEVISQIGLDPSKPYVGLLTNVMWDAQLHYPTNAFPSMRAWIVHTIRYFAKRRDLQLVIRIHPAEVSGTLPSRQRVDEEIKTAFPTLPPNVFIVPPESKVSTYALMAHCNAALIYGTKTGVELSAMGIPVIVAGEAWIRNKGVTYDAESASAFDVLLERLPLATRLDARTVERARKYAYHFFFRRMIPLDFLEPSGDANVFNIRVDNVDELEAGSSVGLDVICDGIIGGRPFIYPAEEHP